ncbi:EAL domain-containing protein [Duganella sp. FT135W]|uniref:EAL domain-containing protein n=1 Tax=Duganella flavida TaxID=2692175 RepID=A0A6L8K5W1_9BURK|nr:EAL domain-containing protein [Duganella flavida]MYM22620.1 EAL domain-containing protein [Duganella flavida]
MPIGPLDYPASPPLARRNQVLARGVSASELVHGLSRKEFVAVFQPYVNALTGKVVAIEATLRWQHPRRGCLVPADFVCEADQQGLLDQLAIELIDQAALAAARWQGTASACVGALCAVPLVVSLSGGLLRSGAARRHLASYSGLQEGRAGVVLGLDDFFGGAQLEKIDLGDCCDTRDALDQALACRLTPWATVVTNIGTILQWYAVAERGLQFVQGDFICPPTRATSVDTALRRWQSSFRAISACSEISSLNPHKGTLCVSLHSP